MDVNGARDFFYGLVPKPKAGHVFNPVRRPVDRFLVLSKGKNPTFSYYLEERIRGCEKPVLIRDLKQRLDDIDPHGLFVVVCRYIGFGQLLWLYRNRRRLAGVALFIDDDIAAAITAKNSDFTYKLYLVGMGVLPLPVLNRLLTNVWVSTPALEAAMRRGDKRGIALLEPLPPGHAYTSRTTPEDDVQPRVTMAFHATGIHDAEHDFLIPVVRDALKSCNELHFEVVAAGRLERLWKEAGLPSGRVAILPMRRWERYLEETSRRHIDILLVPLLRSRVNDVRSGTKRFDAMRMGAAAIFSRSPVYLRDADENEILLEDEHRLWVEAIVRLATDPVLRARSREATAYVVRRLVESVPKTFPLDTDKTVSKEF